MATTRGTSAQREVDYPTSDGRPMAETDVHRDDMVDLIQVLQERFAADPNVYVSGNLLLFYEEGNRRKHVAPDVFVVRGVPKLPRRQFYLLWNEGKAPEVVIEITSKTTKREDRTKKLVLYRDVLKVAEYFQFDPTEDYLKPPLQGQRLVGGEYVAIEPVAGRLPSAILSLHLERRGETLRLYDPAMGRCLPTPAERAAEEQEARLRAEEAQQREAEARQQVEAENERLRQELEALRRARSGGA